MERNGVCVMNNNDNNNDNNNNNDNDNDNDDLNHDVLWVPSDKGLKIRGASIRMVR